jgi:hypothetical protein
MHRATVDRVSDLRVKCICAHAGQAFAIPDGQVDQRKLQQQLESRYVPSIALLSPALGAEIRASSLVSR